MLKRSLRLAAIIMISLVANAAPASAEPSLSPPLLDPNGLLPPGHNPASVPAANGGDPVPAIPMREDTREAILLFDPEKTSRRHYDLVSCLDGMTFGFGNWPQAKFGGILAELRNNDHAGRAFTQRVIEAFEANSGAWLAFRAETGAETTKPTKSAVLAGFEMLFPKHGRRNAPVRVSPHDICWPRPRRGVSYYEDYQFWLVPALKRALRDPAVVAAQVKHWEGDVLDPAVADATAMGITGPGVYLIAFYRSNPGQAPGLKTAITARKPPLILRAGGRMWAWNKPPGHLAGAAKQDWRNLLLWQALCPQAGRKFRIRNRNVAFFDRFLTKTFTLPAWGTSSRGSRKDINCDPAQVRLRAEQS